MHVIEGACHSSRGAYLSETQAGLMPIKNTFALLEGPKLAVSCAAVKRVHAQKGYSPNDYKVCLMREGLEGQVMFPGGRVEAEVEPMRAGLKYLRRQTGLEGAQGFSVHVSGKPMQDSHVVTLFFIVPISMEAKTTGFPSMETKFHNLSDTMENSNGSYEFIHGQQSMLFAVDHWLKQRHSVPFVNLDMLFGLRTKQGTGGRILALIENPLFEAQANPPENDLLVALNNPIFETADRTSMSLQI